MLGMTGRKWVGIDFDGTTVWKNPHFTSEDFGKTGNPLPAMIALARDLLREGLDVRIFTARVTPTLDPQRQREAAESTLVVQDFCIHHFGRALPITNAKDDDCAAILDDIAFHVTRNTGLVVDPQGFRLRLTEIYGVKI